MKKAKVVEELEKAGFSTDHITAHKDGSFTWKRSFFYTHGNSARKLAMRMKEALPITIVEAYDDWKEWPKTSYFVVRFRTNQI